MAKAGIFNEDDRVELIEGEIVEMSPIGPRHAGTVNRLIGCFIPLQMERRVTITVQNPIRLGKYSEPQPDLALLKPRPDFYSTSHPEPKDILLIVEIAETSVDIDRQVKIPLYAQAGIPEVWLLDLSEEKIKVYQEPTPQGYRKVDKLERVKLYPLTPSPN